MLLLVLAMLNERPMHPYEMLRLVAERDKHSVVNVKRGSVYHAVERLQSAGLVEEQETSREGRRPERTVYRLTEAGQDEVRTWMFDMLRRPKDEFPEFTTVVAFLPVLTAQEVASALRHRLIVLDRTIGGLEATGRTIGDRIPRVFVIEEEYQLAMVRAERAWVAGVLADLESGRFSWDYEELRRWADAASGPGGPLEGVGDPPD